jgi:ubiquinone/menaquinone biosynthesis C-methylase UbiE
MADKHQYPTARFEGVKPALRDGKTEALAGLIRERTRAPIRRLLVVGCGSGLEAAILAGELGAQVVGVDLDSSFDRAAAAAVDLRRGDATCLDFADGSFDFVFSYHALEHIPAYGKALSEMERVLSKGGAYCVGTPNRLRLFGYLGSKDATWRDKIAWNLADWKARLLGKFRNEYGAHAGFSSGELDASLAEIFDQTEEITLPYYQRIYQKYAVWVSFLGKLGLGRFLFPSVYFMGGK